jgi:hypothetical protein
MLALILAAATALPAVPPEGAYTYTVAVAGNMTGKTTITMSRTPGGVVLTESASASYRGSDFAGTATLNLDALLAPAHYSAVYSPPGQTIHAAIAFNGPNATETADTGGMTFNLGTNTKHFAVLDGTLFSGFFILPSQVRAWNAQAFTAVSPMFQRGGPITLDRALKPNRPSGVPPADLALSVSDPLEFTIWYDPATLIVDELDIPQQDATYVRLRSR